MEGCQKAVNLFAEEFSCGKVKYMKRSIVRYILVVIALLAFSAIAASQSSKPAQIEEMIGPFTEQGYFSGVVVASEDGKVIYEKGFGIANADFQIPNKPDTRIGIASITKPMTTVILNRLIEEKKIATDQRVSKYIPDFPNGNKITIEMLASHRSGIPHRVMPTEQEAVPHTSAEMVDKIAQAKLEFEPGSQRLYSSAGFALLARILEIASGRQYAQLLQQYVFDPAGMKDSLDFDGEKIIPRRAQDYLLRPKGLVNAALMDYSFLIGAGSVFGTARDIHSFGEALLDGKYGKAARDALVRDNVFRADGRTNGHRAYVEIDREKKYGYVVLSNLSSGAFDIISQGLTDILTGKESTTKAFRFPKIVSLSDKELADYEGTYNRTDGGTFRIALKDGILYSANLAIYPTANDCFFDYAFFGEVCFGRDESKAVNSIVWKGLTFELKGQKP